MELFFQYGNYIFTPLHILVCLILIAVVLLQTGKGADMAGVFGGAGTQTAFGPRGVENYLSRLTKWAAFTFMVTSLALSMVRSGIGNDDADDLPTREEVESAAGSSLPGVTTETAAPAGATDIPPGEIDFSAGGDGGTTTSGVEVGMDELPAGDGVDAGGEAALEPGSTTEPEPSSSPQTP